MTPFEYYKNGEEMGGKIRFTKGIYYGEVLKVLGLIHHDG
jgi:hypothetical protein